MNKTIKRTVTAGILVFSLTTPLVHPVDTDAASAKINRKKLTLYTGKTAQLKIKGTSGKVIWKSSNKKVAPVHKKGTVKALKTGKAKITATLKIRKKTKRFFCNVTVKRRTSQACSQSPAVSTAPGAMVKPAATMAPSSTQTYKPTSTKKPTTAPTSTKKPTTASTPIATQRPSVTLKPSATQKPVATTAPSTSTVTEQSAYATLNSLRSTYPEGMPLTNSYYYYSPKFGNGYGCYGFAAKLSDTVFGTEKAYTTHSTFDNIKVGDNIRIGNSHSVIVLTKESNYITVVEGNYNSSVHWDRKITSSSLASSGFKVYTRY